eukprot:TRINITY_DN4651_c0_g1_i2.p1 TRINITY_DN4651_c0_g1~~TRINITY_DN4651_c0_g1_i2.p1  ORF type:complete len:440 (+),score=84.38 TRINITY_DN4651_c0_g1_i2:76-1395(+)
MEFLQAFQDRRYAPIGNSFLVLGGKQDVRLFRSRSIGSLTLPERQTTECGVPAPAAVGRQQKPLPPSAHAKLVARQEEEPKARRDKGLTCSLPLQAAAYGQSRTWEDQPAPPVEWSQDCFDSLDKTVMDASLGDSTASTMASETNYSLANDLLSSALTLMNPETPSYGMPAEAPPQQPQEQRWLSLLATMPAPASAAPQTPMRKPDGSWALPIGPYSYSASQSPMAAYANTPTAMSAVHHPSMMPVPPLSDSTSPSFGMPPICAAVSLPRVESQEVPLAGLVAQPVAPAVPQPLAQPPVNRSLLEDTADEEAPITTLMVRNLPTDLAQKALLQELDDSGFDGLYDFCYLPRAFNSGENHGYAFVNFTSPAAAGLLVGAWHRQVRFGNNRPLNLSPAVLQGKDANVRKWCNIRLKRIRNRDFRPFVSPALGQAESDENSR